MNIACLCLSVQTTPGLARQQKLLAALLEVLVQDSEEPAEQVEHRVTKKERLSGGSEIQGSPSTLSP